MTAAAETRRKAPSGRSAVAAQAAAPPATMASPRSTHAAARRIGMPENSVSRIFAWISTPGIVRNGANGVGNTSWRICVVAPTRTIWPLKTSGGISPLTMRE